MKPFVNWAGGKRSLYNQLKPYFPKEYNTYIEPFFGGGAILLKEQPQKAIVSDINKKLINCYQQIKSNPFEVINELASLNNKYNGKDTYYQIRDSFNSDINANTFQNAAKLIWLNKYCFNGLYRENKQGLFNSPFGNKKQIVQFDNDNILEISSYLNKNEIDIVDLDFEIVCSVAKEGDFVYFDPPYAPISKTATFVDYTQQGFSNVEQIRLKNLLDKLTKKGVKWMLNNSVCDFTKNLYSNYKQITLDSKRTINCDKDNRKGQDLLVLNY